MPFNQPAAFALNRRRLDKGIASSLVQGVRQNELEGVQVMSFITYAIQMQAAAHELQLAFDANDNASMQGCITQSGPAKSGSPRTCRVSA